MSAVSEQKSDPNLERAARVVGPAATIAFLAMGVVMALALGRPMLAPMAFVLVGLAALATLGASRLSGWALLPPLGFVAVVVALIGTGVSANLGWMALCIISGWVAVLCSRSAAVLMVLFMMAILALQLFLDSSEPGWFAWALGMLISGIGFRYDNRLRAAHRELQEAQAQLAERTRAEERQRLAGEVHDVIGHALTVSLLHIESARLAVDDSPEDARAALEEAERLSRRSLDEVRAAVGLMRTSGQQAAPMPDAGDIDELVESFRRAGAVIDAELSDRLAEVSAARGLAAYRVVQEALTNATRHAPGRPVAVRVEEEAGAVVVDVRNPGAGPAGPPGSGLRGMRDRVEALGGDLTAGPAGDGWAVTARLPA